MHGAQGAVGRPPVALPAPACRCVPCQAAPRPTAEPAPARPTATRRGTLAALAGAALACQPGPAAMAAAAPTQTILHVGPGAEFTTLAAAIAAAPPGAVVAVAPGTYSERLVLDTPVTLAAATWLVSPSSSTPAVSLTPDVTLAWRTAAPYEATVDVRVPGVCLAGLSIAHASPSVGDDFAVHVRQGGGLELTACVISSATGSGLGAEGVASAIRTAFVDCAAYGAALFAAGSSLDGCAVAGNKRGGVLVRADGSVAVTRLAASRNAGPALDLAAGEGVFRQCELGGGGVRLGVAWEGGPACTE